MRLSYTVSPADGVRLITEYAKTYSQLTVINTGTATAYLGDDSSVTVSNGIPLAAGMSTAWTQPMLYAAVTAATTLIITDAAASPLSANLPAPVDTWRYPSEHSSIIWEAGHVFDLVQDTPGSYAQRGIYLSVTFCSLYATGSGGNWEGHFYAQMDSGLVVPLLYTTSAVRSGAAVSPPWYSQAASSGATLYTASASAALPAGGSYSIHMAVDSVSNNLGACYFEIQPGGFIMIPT